MQEAKNKLVASLKADMTARLLPVHIQKYVAIFLQRKWRKSPRYSSATEDEALSFRAAFTDGSSSDSDVAPTNDEREQVRGSPQL